MHTAYYMSSIARGISLYLFDINLLLNITMIKNIGFYFYLYKVFVYLEMVNFDIRLSRDNDKYSDH